MKSDNHFIRTAFRGLESMKRYVRSSNISLSSFFVSVSARKKGAAPDQREREREKGKKNLWHDEMSSGNACVEWNAHTRLVQHASSWSTRGSKVSRMNAAVVPASPYESG